MRQAQVVLIQNGDMSQSSLNSIGLDLSQIFMGSIQAVWTGTPVGNFLIQVSNDLVVPGTTNPSSNVINWSNYTGSTVAAGGTNGNWTWNISNIGYRWVRLNYTQGSVSSGTLAATSFIKGY